MTKNYYQSQPVLKTIRYLVFFLMLVGGVLSASAQPIPTTQPIPIKGRVVDSQGESIPGVTVMVAGTTIGTLTDLDGYYEINVPNEQSVLTFSYIGFNKQEITPGNRRLINVTLIDDQVTLEDVVVIGYGTTRVKDLTSAITTVTASEITKTPTGSPMQALQGKVAGLQIISNGEPGGSPTVRVRGLGSNDGGNANPLYVVDGIMFNSISFLNPSDIATMSVLKDASASAIYGVRAANGVVLIETKSGAFNKKAQFTYDGYYGVQTPLNVLKMANTEQFVTMANESGSTPDVTFIKNAIERFGANPNNPDLPNVDTDWYKELMRTSAPIQNHSISVSGGSANASYLIGASYFSQEGMMDVRDDYERYGLRGKLDFKATDWLTIGTNFNWTKTDRVSQAGNSAWNEAYYAVPILPVYDEKNTDATPVKFSNAQLLGYRNTQNPFPGITYTKRFNNPNRYFINVYATVDILPKVLSFKTMFNNSNEFVNDLEVAFPYELGNNSRRTQANSYVQRNQETNTNQAWDNILTYTNKFNRHDLTVTAGTSYMSETRTNLRARGLDIPVDQPWAWYIEQALTRPGTEIRNSGSKIYTMSYFGRVAYNYDNRYLVYGTYRADGTSKYQEKWGYFPTIGAGWVISEEGFMKDQKVINYLKLRGSWGQLGNNAVGVSSGTQTVSNVYAAINDVYTTGIRSGGVFSYLKWELTEETNVGLTATFLDNRLSLDADYYVRDTKDAVIPVSFPLIAGQVDKNVGVIRNSGFEMALSWSDRFANDFRYSVGVNITTLKNEMRNLYGQLYLTNGSAEFQRRTYVGQPLMAFYGWETNGVYQNQAEIDADPVAVANNLVPGDFRYKDLDNNNIIDDKDRKILGSYLPSFSYGGNIDLSYKRFDFSISFFGQAGNKVLNRKRGEIIWTKDANMDADLAKNRWHGEGTSNKYPSSAGLRKPWNLKMSNFFVEDGAFMRINNIILGYNFKTATIFGDNKLDARLTLSANRPFIFSNYNGFNPEVTNGEDSQMYPLSSIYTVGLSLKF